VNDDAPLRKIIHVDMDAFFASVEQRDDPALRGRPLAVGGAGPRGVVAAASYEARRFGVRSAMPSVTARRRCPDLLFVPPRFDRYREVSAQIRAIFLDYTDLVEPLSLDEAYLDVSADRRGLGSATATAREIRARIAAETGLTASAGVSYNKFLAKLASDANKPDGMAVITPARAPAFLETLKVSRFHGVGPRTAEKMAALGIHTGADLRAWSLVDLQRRFGSAGAWFHDLARGICHRQVRPDRERKSIGAEDTFAQDLTGPDELAAELDRIGRHVWRRIAERGISGRTVTLKVKYQDFRIVTRARSLPRAVADADAFVATGRQLLQGLLPVPKGVRLLGLTLSGLNGGERTEAAEPALPLPLAD
jgi:DNA polymerase IV